MFSNLNKNLSDRKLRIPTQESVESGSSSNQYQLNNINNQVNQNIFSNLCPQISNNVSRNTPKSGSNIAFNNEE